MKRKKFSKKTSLKSKSLVQGELQKYDINKMSINNQSSNTKTTNEINSVNEIIQNENDKLLKYVIVSKPITFRVGRFKMTIPTYQELELINPLTQQSYKKLKKIQLFRIMAIRDIPEINIKKGDLGGWVDNQDALSQDGNCWIFNNAMVVNKLGGQVSGNALIYGNAKVLGGKVGGNAKMYGNSAILDNSQLDDFAQLHDNCIIAQNAHVCGRAYLSNNVKVLGKSRVCGQTIVTDNCIVQDEASIDKSVTLQDDVIVKDSCQIIGGKLSGQLVIGGETIIHDNPNLNGKLTILGKSYIHGNGNLTTDLHCQELNQELKDVEIITLENSNKKSLIKTINTTPNTTLLYPSKNDIEQTK